MPPEPCTCQRCGGPRTKAKHGVRRFCDKCQDWMEWQREENRKALGRVRKAKRMKRISEDFR